MPLIEKNLLQKGIFRIFFEGPAYGPGYVCVKCDIIALFEKINTVNC